MQLHIAAKIHKVSEKTTKQFKILNKSFTANVWLFSVFHVFLQSEHNKEYRMIHIANPIYDVVFKYLMADERIARTILSALLKMDIVAIEVRPHEYPNSQRDTLSVFRIDFAATVRNADDTTHIVLIELQKTWLETETLRFRQYLGVQYQNPANMNKDGYGLPMIAVYLLGHRVGNIEEPVLYVHHEARNRDGQVVTKGLPDPFVSSLTHDSVIVQIPLLHGQVNTRLDQVLSFFDQTQKSRDDQHTLLIDEGRYADDPDMHRILNRLLSAASEPQMRQDMNVEDEYFSIIEKRDTEILMRDRKLAEQKVTLEKQKVTLEKQQSQLDEKTAQLRTSVKMLHKKGIPAKEIAEMLNMDCDTVKSMLD